MVKQTDGRLYAYNLHHQVEDSFEQMLSLEPNGVYLLGYQVSA